MKARLPKSFMQLPQSEKEIINNVLTAEIEEQVNKNMAKLQKLWLKFACIVLNRNFGFGKKRCLLFLANWREIYRVNSKLETEAEQTAYLDERINKIFGADYPTKFIDKLEEW